MNERYYLVFAFSRDGARLLFLVEDTIAEANIDPLPSVVDFMMTELNRIYTVTEWCELGPELAGRMRDNGLIDYYVSNVEASYELEQNL